MTHGPTRLEDLSSGRLGDEERTRPAANDFHALVDAASAALFVYRRDEVVWLNRAAELLTGCSREELVGKPFSGLVAEEFREVVRRREADRLEGKTVRDPYEVRVLRKDAAPKWVELSGRVVELQEGEAVVGTLIDVGERKRAEAAVRDRETRLKMAQRAGRSVIWDWNILTDELMVSEEAEVAFELAGTRPTGKGFLKLLHPEDRESVKEEVRAALVDGKVLSVEARILTSSGDVRWLALRGHSLRNHLGWTVRVLGVATDVTERKQVEHALSQEQERVQVTLASIGDGVIRTDARGIVDFMNPAAERLTGWMVSEAVGQPVLRVLNLLDEITKRPVPSPIERCVREKRTVVTPGRLVRRDGTELEVRLSTALIRDREERLVGVVMVFRDLTEVRSVERELMYVATHDGLTGLINRSEFERRIEQALKTARQESRRHALCYLDLDQFKLVNDTCGHMAGDEMLKQIGSLLKCRLREADTLARLGGDEFGVLLENCPPRRAREIAHELCEEIRSFRFSWKGKLFSVGVSVGLIAIDADSGDLAQVLSAADAACYLAKDNGGNRVHEYEPDETGVAERYNQLQLIQRINDALERHCFQLYVQPVQPLIATASTRPIYEILVRMIDDQGNLVLPATFIPTAERHRLISAIDRWVVRTALAGIAAKRDLGSTSNKVYAINLSGQSLGDEEFLNFVVDEFESFAIPAERLCFEVTETAAISNLGRAIRFITVLKGKGCRFVLDDFGSGLSSFAYLRNLPVDFLKIDAQFVKRVASDPIHRALVESINHIGHVMQMKTIAEGVEDATTLNELRKLKVDYAQGFHIARPEPLK